ncbi:MAG: class I SAM-dependent methyltransferase, partial [Kamptonema sp. SIO4C4]|nr:class I SAM-dependent methyltransferase [Kamptonema sp. SIO4C4]
MIYPGEVFAQTQEFDTNIRQLLPYYDEMLEAIVLCLPTEAKRILELGCGTGELTRKLLHHCPDAHVTAVDYSPRMVDFLQAKLDLQGEKDRVKVVHLDFGAWANNEAHIDFTGHFDAVISSLAIHHLSDRMKEKLLQKIAHSLNPSGCFWNADPVLPEFPELANIYKQSRQKWAQQHNIDLDTVRSKVGKSETQGYSSQDQLATLDDHLQMLKK